MRTAAFTVMVFALAVGTADAQGRGRGRNNSQGIPPGHMPPPGECRVWYEGVPPGRQPAPTSCDQAERRASRDRDARVIYGNDRNRGNDRYRNDRYEDRNDRYEDREDRDDGRVYEDERNRRRTPIEVMRDRIRNRYPNGTATNESRRSNAGYDNGFRDGMTKGREDRGDNDSFDPVRHAWYRSGNRGYNSQYGTRDDYKLAYRDGFEAGYQQGYGRIVRR